MEARFKTRLQLEAISGKISPSVLVRGRASPSSFVGGVSPSLGACSTGGCSEECVENWLAEGFLGCLLHRLHGRHYPLLGRLLLMLLVLLKDVGGLPEAQVCIVQLTSQVHITKPLYFQN